MADNEFENEYTMPVIPGGAGSFASANAPFTILTVQDGRYMGQFGQGGANARFAGDAGDTGIDTCNM